MRKARYRGRRKRRLQALTSATGSGRGHMWAATTSPSAYAARTTAMATSMTM